MAMCWSPAGPSTTSIRWSSVRYPREAATAGGTAMAQTIAIAPRSAAQRRVGPQVPLEAPDENEVPLKAPGKSCSSRPAHHHSASTTGLADVTPRGARASRLFLMSAGWPDARRSTPASGGNPVPDGSPGSSAPPESKRGAKALVAALVLVLLVVFVIRNSQRVSVDFILIQGHFRMI